MEDQLEGSLEGHLVEIFGVEAKLRPFHSVEELDDDNTEGVCELVDPNGLIGRAIHFASWDQAYIVMTFDRLLFKVSEGNLRAFEPPDPVDGGFDVVWPDEPGGQEVFAFAMVDALSRKDFCVVQMWMSKEEHDAALDEARSKTTWNLPDPLIESAMLGRENNTKYHLLDAHVPNSESGEILEECDRNLTVLLSLLEPYAEALGCNLWGRMNGMLRTPLTQSDQSLRRMTMGGDQDKILGHLTFLERRKLLLMHLIDNSGGELQLFSKDGSGSAVSIPLVSNRLVVVRNDRLGFAYRPQGFSVLMQAWSLSEPLAPSGTRDDVVELPLQMQGRRAHIVAAETRYPGKVGSYEEYWSMAASGTDSSTKVPAARFDIDLYFSESKDEGHSYTRHGAFISDELMALFDNRAFKISRREAEMMSPAQRVALEVAHTALSQAHWRGAPCGKHWGVFLGDSGSFWPFTPRRGDPYQLTGVSNCHTGGRLSQCLGLSGPCVVVDTACSSSLVAVSLAHTAVRRHQEDQPKPNARTSTDSALAVGVGLMLAVREYINYSGPGMLSARGRCFTFNESADGFGRGEGCGCLVMRSSDEDADTEGMLACLVGSAVNQDGRSASMTAPHGPSQQMCLRASMQELDLKAEEIAMAECHGTGTALGDPIEVGALRAVMSDKHSPRDAPLLNTSAKTQIGHLEAAAGMAGVIKCILSVVNSTSSPNAHLLTLNPHMDINGYPAYFVSEPSDHSTGSSIAGVSSFGFGGTNARGDIWGRCLCGPRRTSELFTGSVFTQRLAFYDRVEENGFPGPHGSDEVFVLGSWDARSELWPMESTALGEYSVTVRLGETCREHFYIVLNEDLNLAIHPTHHRANQSAEIQGPQINKQDLCWLIDGKADGVSSGTFYEISFTWSFTWELGEHMKVTWQPTTAPPSELQLTHYPHVYSITGTFTSWKPREMPKDMEQEGRWSTLVRIGLSGEEEFQFTRDNDPKQMIYPAEPQARKTCIPVRGPDEHGQGRHWLLRGPSGEVVTVDLVVSNGDISVITASQAKARTWTSAGDRTWSVYSVAGSWNGWKPVLMVADQKEQDTYTHRLRLGEMGKEEFQIMEGEEGRRLYPHKRSAQLGEGMLCGPDTKGHELNWQIRGEPGQEFEIVLDFGITNGLWVVSWMEVNDEERPSVLETGADGLQQEVSLTSAA